MHDDEAHATAATDPRFLPVQRAFVRAHRWSDPGRVRLGRAPEGVDLRLAAEQIMAWQKLREKAPAWIADADLVLPSARAVEQASSPRTAAYQAGLVSGRLLVDLSGGLGVDTLAFAQRFESVWHVERDPAISAAFAWNAPRLGGATVRVITASAASVLDQLPPDAVVYVDPARRDASDRRVDGFADASPDMTQLLPVLLARGHMVLIKAAPMLDLVAGLRALRQVRAVHVVSMGNVCRELLFLCDSGAPDAAASERVLDDVPITCVELRDQLPPQPFVFSRRSERDAVPVIGPVGAYVYDAHAAIRKAGAFRTVATAFGLVKLGPNTHLYTADTCIADFPGRTFAVRASVTGDPRPLLTDRRANVIERNHPLSAEALRDRYRLRDGGEDFVIGYRDADDRPRLLFAARV
ncbi:MAG: THUMP-like domain-containing protein, partial [Gammaproteobacteria bacterium]